MRPGSEVRAADRDDLVAVGELMASATGAGAAGVGADVEPGGRPMLPHLSVYLAAGGRVLVTELDGRIVGFVLARTVGPYLFADHPAWIIDLLFVALDARRRGVGRSLVAGIAALAGENDAPHVYVGASAGDRGMQRFLARLGFAPAAGHRVVATSTLLRRLALDGAVPARRGRRDATRAAIEDVVARRRRFREASATTGQIDLREGRAS